MEKMSNMDEMVSALADGELHGDAFAHAVDALAIDPGARESWHAYHLVGDVLRSAELASPCTLRTLAQSASSSSARIIGRPVCTP